MRKERLYLFLVLIFFLGFILPQLFNPNQGFLFIIEELVFGTGLIIGILVFGKNIQKIISKLEKRYPWKTDPIKRLSKNGKYWLIYTAGLGGILFVFSGLYLHIYGMPEAYYEILITKSSISGHRYPNRFPSFWQAFPRSFGFSSLLFTVLFLIEEMIVYYERQTKERVTTQEMLKEQALMKASVLKKQLNPHFMFNSLNVLSGLIHEDIERSDKFIKEMAEIYRYVLEQSEKALSTLEQETKFIESYFYLLKIRFGEKLAYHIDIPIGKHAYQIPSLTLEILVENAVKHNIVSEKMPLRIDIYIQNDRLIVKNNLQMREDDVASMGTGISNLKERLALLGVEGATFGIESDSYVASIPLLNPN